MPKKSHNRNQQQRKPRGSTQPATGQLRIIGGQWRGRKLTFPAIDGLRPTGDRLRETLFNWLQADIHGAHCLDMFAGSGALGLEALSRGAALATFIDNNTAAARAINAHLSVLQAQSQASVLCTDVIGWLNSEPVAKPFDIIFMDPPFQQDLWNAAMAALSNSGCLAPETLVYIETPVQQALAVPLAWSLYKEKTTSQLRCALYCAGNKNAAEWPEQ